MPTFPIQYAERRPPPGATSVPAQLDVRTGAVRAAETIARAGEQIATTGLKILDDIDRARDEVETAEQKLAIDGYADTFISTATTTGNREARAKLLEEAEGKMVAAGQTRRAKVYAMSAVSSLRTRAMRLDLDMEIKDKRKRFEIALTQLAGRGDVDAYIETLSGGRDVNLISPAEAENRIDRAPVTVRLEVMRNAIANKDAGAARRVGAELKHMDLTTEEGEYLGDRERDLAALEQTNSDGALVSVLADMHANRDALPGERRRIGDELIQRILRSGSTPSSAAVMIDRVKKWQTGAGVLTDPVVHADLSARIMRFSATSTRDEYKAIRGEILSNAGRLSDGDVQRLLESLDTEVSKEVADVKATLVDSAISNERISKLDVPDIERIYAAWQKTRKAAPTPKEAEEFLSGVLMHYVPLTPLKAAYSPQRIQTVLGQLRSKALYVRATGRAYPVKRPEDVLAWVSGPEGLGYYWQYVAPEAEGIIRQNWPGMVIPARPELPSRDKNLRIYVDEDQYRLWPGETRYLAEDGTIRVKGGK